MPLVSCSSEVDWKDLSFDDFEKTFVSQFGWPNEKQDWNTAKQYTVNADIDMGGSWTLKVYTADPEKEPGKSFLIGSFTVDANSPEPVYVDGPYTLETICVGIEYGSISARKNILPSEAGVVNVEFADEDLVFGPLPEADKMSYFLAYEVADTIGSYLDYNDVVLEVVHVSGEETADVRLRAVGARDEMVVNYVDDADRMELFGEVHEAFGYRTLDRLINVEKGKHDYRVPIEYKGLNVGKDFSMAKDAGRFEVSLPAARKGRRANLFLLPAEEPYLGTPSNVVVIANPTWDWMSEGGYYDPKSSSFTAWLRSYRLYNQWWDNLWAFNELAIAEGNTYRPDFGYQDMIFGYEDIKNTEADNLIIDYSRLLPYTKANIGAEIGFVITERYGGNVKVSLQRSDGGPFEWYLGDAYVHVFEDNNVDAGRGYAEACHILVSTNTLKDIVNKKANLKVIFTRGSSKAELNSVWIKEK